jgi:hypothetical protein
MPQNTPDEDVIDSLKNEVKRLKLSLRLISLIESNRNMHLGRPRSGDMNCIFCISYISSNDGAFGEHIDIGDLEQAISKFNKI